MRPFPLLGLAVLLSAGCAGVLTPGHGPGGYPPGTMVYVMPGPQPCGPVGCAPCGPSPCGPCHSGGPRRWYRSWEAFWLTLRGGPITVLSTPPASGPGGGATPYVPPPMPTFGIDPADTALRPPVMFYETPLPPGAPERLREPPVPQSFGPALPMPMPMPLPPLQNTSEPGLAPPLGAENRLIPVTTR